MDNQITTDKIRQGLRTAFENKTIQSDMEYRPQFVFNDFRKGRKVLASLEREFKYCDEFFISVAFITMSGLVSLLPTLKELEDKGVRGKIITTDYLCFSDPKALDKLQEFSNIELRLFKSVDNVGFHTKGYIFRSGDIYRIIVGSSNLTQNALTKNEEWNTQLISRQDGEYKYTLMDRFDQLWDDKNCVDYDVIKSEYQSAYEQHKKQRKIEFESTEIDSDDFVENELVADGHHPPYVINSDRNKLSPNVMQSEFVDEMRKLENVGAKRALLISATGTGKTYASAFAVRDYKPQRLLFIVHREQIAKQALKSYRRVMGKGVTMGLLSGNSKNTSSQFLFSTMQTISKEDVYCQFSPYEFDYIVVDEAHRAGAPSYQKIFNYFKPKMFLGMTATPDRSDGYDIYDLFDHNIAYEIRLKQALEDDLLCPFHYFGITDIQLADNQDDDEGDLKDFARLTCDERVKHIIKQINFYGYSGNRVKGLIFCRGKQEAEDLSKKFNQAGFRTVHLLGADSQEQREDAVDRLVSDTRADYLQYIFTVDIFNEGVDVPEINQVIMLRPTQSPIVFIQQLGRGLRKYQDKEYVVILDFIGNYVGNNFMIPMALTGDRSYNKDNIRRCLLEGSRVTPGASTIHFDKVAKERIFKSIDLTNISDLRRIKESYQNLKNKLGRIPKLMDFDRYGEMDVICLFQNKSLGSYHTFLSKYDRNDYKVKFTPLEETFLKFISIKWAEGKRPHELELLDILLNNPSDIFTQLEYRLKDKWDVDFRINTKTNLVNIMTGNYLTGTGAATWQGCIFLEKVGNEYVIAKEFAKCLGNKIFKSNIEELVEFGLHRYKKNYSKPENGNDFKLYQKYSYEDVCRLLNWSKHVIPQNMGGYKYDDITKTFPVFINYDKADDVKDSLAYHDRFLSNGQLISLTKSTSSLQSSDVIRFISAEELGIDIDLFVRKNKDDGTAKNFYYLGRMKIDHIEQGENKYYSIDDINTLGKGTINNKKGIEMFWNLDRSVREDIYDYITSEDA